MQDKLVDIKIRQEYRDKLKEYCKYSGYKMYSFVEQLIDKNCNITKPNKKNILLSSKK